MSHQMSCPDLREQHLLVSVRSVRSFNRHGVIHFWRAALLLGILAIGGGDSWGQTWISAVSASTTAGAAKITWTTAVPSDSQVEYGTTVAYRNVTAVAAAKVASHSVALSGLSGGTMYHFRVRSSDANGVLVIGPDYALRISIPVTVSLTPQSATLAANGTQRFTATVSNDPNQAVSWSATLPCRPPGRPGQSIRLALGHRCAVRA